MDALEWIATREPRPPAALVARMTRALTEHPASAGAPIHSQLVTAATAILASGTLAAAPTDDTGDCLDIRTSDRRGALDLLAADALVTYAMEFASDDCASFDAVAGSAMRAISDLR